MSEHLIHEYVQKTDLNQKDTKILINLDERMHGKEKEMTKTEVLDFLCGLESTSYYTLCKYICVVRNYISFLNEGGETYNAWADITKDEILSCLTLSDKGQSLSREKLMYIVRKLKYVSDQFCILGAYEGFTITEMLELNRDHFDFEKNAILHPISERWFPHSLELMTYAHIALQCYDMDTGHRTYRLYDIKEGLPVVVKSRKPGVPVTRRVLTVRLFNALSGIKEAEGLSAKSIHTISFFSALENNDQGLPVEDFIRSDNKEYLRLLDRYGKTRARTDKIKEQYELYLGGYLE